MVVGLHCLTVNIYVDPIHNVDQRHVHQKGICNTLQANERKEISAIFHNLITNQKEFLKVENLERQSTATRSFSRIKINSFLLSSGNPIECRLLKLWSTLLFIQNNNNKKIVVVAVLPFLFCNLF